MSTQPEKKLHSALTDANLGEAVRSDFLRAWQNAELLLEAFSQGTKLPIIAFLRDALIFESSIAVLLKFGTPIDSEWKAHLSEFVDRKPGMRTAHREIDTPAGLLTILMGEPSLPHENGSLKAGPEIAPMAHSQLSATPEEFSSKEDHREMNKADPALVDSVAELLRHLVFAPVFFRESIISMAHEVGLSLLSMGLLSKEIDELASQISGRADPLNLAHKHLMNLACKHLRAETQLGGVVLRNVLSHSSETRYEITRPQFAQIDLYHLVLEMIELYALLAEKKGIAIEILGIVHLPMIYGSDMEIRRLLHNILNNAVKYSYHSTTHSQRTIQVSARVPYDQGFRQRRFAITFKNYGLGLTREEQARAFEPGFRGQQARREVPIGSGLGLSEALKIMKVHRGQIRLNSQELQANSSGDSTYLTTIELIFPYSTKGDPIQITS